MKRGMPTPRDVDDYITRYPADVQLRLQRIRQAIRNAVPKAEETISYEIPTFKLDGVLIHFAAFSKHIGVYPRVRSDPALAKALAPYKGGKGTVQLPHDEPIPLGLIARMTKFRAKENAGRAAAKRAKK